MTKLAAAKKKDRLSCLNVCSMATLSSFDVVNMLPRATPSCTLPAATAGSNYGSLEVARYLEQGQGSSPEVRWHELLGLGMRGSPIPVKCCRDARNPYGRIDDQRLLPGPAHPLDRRLRCRRGSGCEIFLRFPIVCIRVTDALTKDTIFGARSPIGVVSRPRQCSRAINSCGSITPQISSRAENLYKISPSWKSSGRL